MITVYYTNLNRLGLGWNNKEVVMISIMSMLDMVKMMTKSDSNTWSGS